MKFRFNYNGKVAELPTEARAHIVSTTGIVTITAGEKKTSLFFKRVEIAENVEIELYSENEYSMLNDFAVNYISQK